MMNIFPDSVSSCISSGCTVGLEHRTYKLVLTEKCEGREFELPLEHESFIRI